MARELKDMVVVITGASAGIGRELAIQLNGHGCRLILAARRLELLQELNKSLGGGHAILRADVSNTADCQAIVGRAFDEFGRLDTLICNAGFGEFLAVWEMTASQTRDMFATNVFGTTDCIRAAIPRMIEQPPCQKYRGQIVIVSSGAARRGLPYNGIYSATKAAQLSIGESLRLELRDKSIAVTTVHPIGTETEFFRTAEQMSSRKMNALDRRPRRHSAARVVKGIVKAIRRPRAEVWSSTPTRIGLALNALFPTLGDRVMAMRMHEFQKLNNLQVK
jgi:short-subunit dehydrogenase